MTMPSPRPHSPAARGLQPFLHDDVVTLCAPTQVWSDRAGDILERGVHGYWTADQRIVSGVRVEVAGSHMEALSSATSASGATVFSSLLRGLDDDGADPDVRLDRERVVGPSSITETLTLTSRLVHTTPVDVTVRIVPDATGMDAAKAGADPRPARPRSTADGVAWESGSVSVVLRLNGVRASMEVVGAAVVIHWHAIPGATVEPGAATAPRCGWTLSVSSPDAVVEGVSSARPWSLPPDVGDDRLRRWIAQASADLDALRMRRPGSPDEFLAAGAPWFFTLFGRDSIWAARFLLPVDWHMAASTLRVLAGLQGTRHDPATGEQPGKIMHEIRQARLRANSGQVSLPPLYYGTIDATPLWICLLHDAWRAGMPEAEVEALLPHLERALAWMRDDGDSDRDGLLEYVGTTGRGLSNQGWKDSGDSVQWRDGSLAEGPIALCEVQAYAYEAAVHGADLLDAFGRPGGRSWRDWAARVADRFRQAYWVADEIGPYPAIALDGRKRPVDSLSSNIGHLVGTGLLTAREERVIAARLVSEEMSSGFGLRTLSTSSRGYWPLSYHGGTVWAHDTAVAIAGLTRAGLDHEARVLAEGLLTAAVTFDFRMPELHSGDSLAVADRPAPYPAACRPQAWSAAAAFPVWVALR